MGAGLLLHEILVRGSSYLSETSGLCTWSCSRVSFSLSGPDAAEFLRRLEMNESL